MNPAQRREHERREQEQREADRELARVVEGLRDVDRAVRLYRSGDYRPVHVSLALASELQWPLCGCGNGGIRPGACIAYRGLLWHVHCALKLITDERAAAERSSWAA